MSVAKDMPVRVRLLVPVLSASLLLSLIISLASRTSAAIPQLDPQPNSHTAPITSTIRVDFAVAIDPSSISPRTLPVYASQQGLISGTYQISASQIQFLPDNPFFPGEIVQGTVTTRTRDLTGTILTTPIVWQFRAASGSAPAIFTRHPTAIDSTWSLDAALGDLDSDGDVDIFLGNRDQAATIWFNEGLGNFSTNQMNMGNPFLIDVALGDLDGDGDLDVIQAGIQDNILWLNDGKAAFTHAGQLFSGVGSIFRVALGDIDGDGDLDALTGSACDFMEPDPDCDYAGANLWWNDGSGIFTSSPQPLGHGTINDLALGDLDLDGDLDAVLARNVPPCMVWINLGGGIFTNTQNLSSLSAVSVDLGDLDGDGDLDAFFAPKSAMPSAVWLNDGHGVLSAGQNLEILSPAYLGDLDGDGDLDAFTTGSSNGRIWLNQGNALFIAGQTMQGLQAEWAVLGDLNGDLALDAVTVGQGYPSEVWINQVPPMLEPRYWLPFVRK